MIQTFRHNTNEKHSIPKRIFFKKDSMLIRTITKLNRSLNYEHKFFKENFIKTNTQV